MTPVSVRMFFQQLTSSVIFAARCTIVQSALLWLHVVHPSVRLSVRPSVTLVDQDHTGWKAWKLTARQLAQHLRSSYPKAIYLLPGEHGEIWGRIKVGWEKVVSWSTKAAISLKRVKIEEKLLRKAIGSHQHIARSSLRCDKRHFDDVRYDVIST